MNLRSFLLTCALGAATLLAAVPAAAQVYGGVYVQTAPPAPIYETVPASPGANYYWAAATGNGTATATSGFAATMPSCRTPALSGVRDIGAKGRRAGIGCRATGLTAY